MAAPTQHNHTDLEYSSERTASIEVNSTVPEPTNPNQSLHKILDATSRNRSLLRIQRDLANEAIGLAADFEDGSDIEKVLTNAVLAVACHIIGKGSIQDAEAMRDAMADLVDDLGSARSGKSALAELDTIDRLRRLLSPAPTRSRPSTPQVQLEDTEDLKAEGQTPPPIYHSPRAPPPQNDFRVYKNTKDTTTFVRQGASQSSRYGYEVSRASEFAQETSTHQEQRLAHRVETEGHDPPRKTVPRQVPHTRASVPPTGKSVQTNTPSAMKAAEPQKRTSLPNKRSDDSAKFTPTAQMGGYNESQNSVISTSTSAKTSIRFGADIGRNGIPDSVLNAGKGVDLASYNRAKDEGISNNGTCEINYGPIFR